MTNVLAKYGNKANNSIEITTEDQPIRIVGNRPKTSSGFYTT